MSALKLAVENVCNREVELRVEIDLKKIITSLCDMIVYFCAPEGMTSS